MEKDKWPTSDMGLGAYLRMQGFKIAAVKSLGSRAVFEFEDRDDREAEVNKFFNRGAMVEPLAYRAAMSEMRDMVTLAQRNNGMGGGKSGDNTRR